MNYEYNLEACRTGCPNYGLKWSCPPFSKVYDKLSEGYKYAYILIFSTSMDKYMDIKNKYEEIKASLPRENWIMMGGCEIPRDTPVENMKFLRTISINN